MLQTVLITGGAGFIGSHLCDELLAAGYQVRVLDCLSSQVHGEDAGRPEYLAGEVELILGDVRQPDNVARALDGVDAVIHFAAAVGVGQSMYDVAHYTSVNNLGTAVLLEGLADRPVKRLLVASSMSIYGEGAYVDAAGRPVVGVTRTREQLQRGRWEPFGPDGEPLRPVPTPEEKPAEASSVYALGKWDQERLCLILGEAYGIPTTALRFFNVYGPRQALSNPYTGVLAIFASRLLGGKRPLVFEDGEQTRDFVNVHDVARACRLALESDVAAGETFNVGSGRAVTIREVAEEIAAVTGRTDLAPEITGRYRVGDIRHCFADISRARRILGYEPQVSFREGLEELAEWLADQSAVDRTDEAREQLERRGLMV
jgi:dTDP-L-rhamnose 4-epimerase